MTGNTPSGSFPPKVYLRPQFSSVYLSVFLATIVINSHTLIVEEVELTRQYGIHPNWSLWTALHGLLAAKLLPFPFSDQPWPPMRQLHGIWSPKITWEFAEKPPRQHYTEETVDFIKSRLWPVNILRASRRCGYRGEAVKWGITVVCIACTFFFLETISSLDLAPVLWPFRRDRRWRHQPSHKSPTTTYPILLNEPSTNCSNARYATLKKPKHVKTIRSRFGRRT